MIVSWQKAVGLTSRLACRAVLLGLTACAVVPRVPASPAVLIAPKLMVTLPDPKDLGQSVRAVQLVTAHYGSQVVVFEAHISATPDRFLLVALDSLGRKALTVTWSHGVVTSEAAPWLPTSLRPENMLADIVLIYWPDGVLRRLLQPSGGVLSTPPGQRSISLQGQEVVHIDYQPRNGGSLWSGPLHFRNLAWGYTLDVQSALAAP